MGRRYQEGGAAGEQASGAIRERKKKKGGEAIEHDLLHRFDDDRLLSAVHIISQGKNKKYEKINKALAKSRQSYNFGKGTYISTVRVDRRDFTHSTSSIHHHPFPILHK